MKTQELIDELKRLDPNNEYEVCIKNKPIHRVELVDAYIDGALQSLIQNDEEGYNVIGYRFSTDGKKVRIVTLNLSMCLIENPDIPVEVNGLNERAREIFLSMIEKEREKAREEIKTEK